MNRNYCFTLNNWTEEEYLALKKLDFLYMVVGKEVGESGTPHLQGYVEFQNGKRLSSLKKINNRIHWEARMGTQTEAINYCMKEKNFEEFGTKKNQGKRNDLNALKDEIMAGKRVDTIAEEEPVVYHQYGRALEKLEDIALRKQFRTEMTKGYWYWGETGVGKSHKAFENFSPETHYLWPNDKGWWDGYRGQEVVIFNDFRGEVTYNALLQLVDKWPYQVPRRGREPMPFVSKTVIITSSLPPEQVFHRRQDEDSLEQLLRRFTVTEVVRG